jgi:4-carboxymuconolactone decarboxylase
MVMDSTALGGRLPLVDVARLDPAQQRMLDYLEGSKFPWAERAGFQAQLPDGRAIGPFNFFLHGPEMGLAFNAWMDAEGAGTTLARDIREVVILTVGSVWKAPYELYAHVAVARRVGLDEPVIEAIRTRREPAKASEAIRVAWRFTRDLVETHRVRPEVYAAARDVFGEGGLVDMIHLIGIYLTTCALLNAFEVAAPD